MGVVSNGAESCRGGLPGIFTRAPHYAAWIHLAMERASRSRVPRRHHSVPRLGALAPPRRRRRPHLRRPGPWAPVGGPWGR